MAFDVVNGLTPGQNCAQCRINRNFREGWGCDKPTPQPQHSMACYCSNDSPEPNCEECGGTGVIHLYRCPPSLLADEDGQEALRAVNYFVRNFHAKSRMPSDGGYLDQASTFVEIMDLLSDLQNRKDTADLEKIQSAGKK